MLFDYSTLITSVACKLEYEHSGKEKTHFIAFQKSLPKIFEIVQAQKNSRGFSVYTLKVETKHIHIH